jgi:hypothetical protein
MAKNKKKKKVQTYHQNELVSFKRSKAYLDTCYATARRIFKALGEDDAAFDTFTKRQKQDMFRIQISAPRILAMPGHKVPRQYLRYVQDEVVAYMNWVHFDKEAGVTWMEMVTIGQTLQLVFSAESFLNTLWPAQREIVDRIIKVFNDKDIGLQGQELIASNIRVSLLTLSQPNFRIYGQTIEEHKLSTYRPVMHPVVRIVTHDCQSLRFRYRNKDRMAFRIAMGQYLTVVPYTGATIPIKKIFPNSKQDRVLNVYIQSHAIHRFKERIDTFLPLLRNRFFVLSLMISQQIVRGPNGRLLIACTTPSKEGEKTVGYFAFTIDGDNLLVLTLLPLLSPSVPEGRVLYERLRLSLDDLAYLGMDKLSFFYNVDIEQIPILKKVLFDELHLDYIRRTYNSYQEKNAPFNEKKTLMVKNFFQKLEEQPADATDVLNELAEPDNPEL